ncbi:hypothetical protein HID58_009122 [Brassica napus]|uniref:Uncharacterized protein n=1 Tax=Brassica napus TaxID=3708 RepID=A0ABQ8DU48_BRANA|nr:hypothetical protein HID58_009122 [Brassica napus]
MLALLGVARIPNYKDLDVRRSNCVKSFPLLSKYLSIDIQQSSTFHSRPSRLCTNQKSPVHILKHFIRIRSYINLSQQREQGILQLHCNAFEGLD